MSDSDKSAKERLVIGFQSALCRHGYSFQHGVLYEALKCFESQRSAFVFETIELPVIVNGTSSRADFVLRRVSAHPVFSDRPLYLIAECKRANPSLSRWCFARAPFTRRNGLMSDLFVESVQLDDVGQINTRTLTCGGPSQLPFHIAFEVRSREKGDSSGAGRSAIEDASTQVLRGLNGLVRFLGQYQDVLGRGNGGEIFPAIFTTASLWTSDVDLRTTDLATGNVDLSAASVTEVPWLLYQYYMSPALKHDAWRSFPQRDIGQVAEYEFVRTIAIVNSLAIGSFLTWASAMRVR